MYTGVGSRGVRSELPYVAAVSDGGRGAEDGLVRFPAPPAAHVVGGPTGGRRSSSSLPPSHRSSAAWLWSSIRGWGGGSSSPPIRVGPGRGSVGTMPTLPHCSPPPVSVRVSFMSFSPAPRGGGSVLRRSWGLVRTGLGLGSGLVIGFDPGSNWHGPSPSHTAPFPATRMA